MKDEQYQKNWEDYRRREKLYWITFVLLFLMHPIVFQIKDFFAESRQDILFTILLIGWGFWLFGLARVEFWKCPRCRGAFHLPIRGFYSREKCKTCELPKYAGSSFF